MKVIVRYRDNPDLDEFCEAQPTDRGPKGSLYVQGEEWGAVMHPDQLNNPEMPVWYEYAES